MFLDKGSLEADARKYEVRCSSSAQLLWNADLGNPGKTVPTPYFRSLKEAYNGACTYHAASVYIDYRFSGNVDLNTLLSLSSNAKVKFGNNENGPLTIGIF